jgi:hypothetical protein
MLLTNFVIKYLKNIVLLIFFFLDDLILNLDLVNHIELILLNFVRFIFLNRNETQSIKLKSNEGNTSIHLKCFIAKMFQRLLSSHDIHSLTFTLIVSSQE